MEKFWDRIVMGIVLLILGVAVIGAIATYWWIIVIAAVIISGIIIGARLLMRRLFGGSNDDDGGDRGVHIHIHNHP